MSGPGVMICRNLSAVLTPQQFHEHDIHVEFFRVHMLTKGRELANACLAIIESLHAVSH